ncbi:hypothetical protein B0H19DRAFT_1140808 [Mycena capillaripes]|nr:hypothetical protein B0H19DRAFT_1140808 [Mycena capillaripes]
MVAMGGGDKFCTFVFFLWMQWQLAKSVVQKLGLSIFALENLSSFDRHFVMFAQARSGKQRRKERLRREKHAKAQQRYREKNAAELREKAKLRMCAWRAAIKEDPEKRNEANEVRREVDADYRERQRQKKFIKKWGQDSFDKIYLPLYRIHGNQTGKLPFALESKAAEAKRLAEEEAGGVA